MQCLANPGSNDISAQEQYEQQHEQSQQFCIQFWPSCPSLDLTMNLIYLRPLPKEQTFDPLCQHLSLSISKVGLKE
eukprot:6481464-Amphidinium_carterae.1